MVTEAQEHRDGLPALLDREVVYAPKFEAADESHLVQVAEIIRNGGIVAFPFNGVFGLFGDVDNPQAAERIIEAKGRPRDRKLIAVCTPEDIDKFADLQRTIYPKEQLVALLTGIHALGVILPASNQAPDHLTVGEGMESTILVIWTEYRPLRTMMGYLQGLGVRGFVGTSANQSGEATHVDQDKLYDDFGTMLQAVVSASFRHLPDNRRRSTSIVDFTNHHPRLHREGNVPEDELREALSRHGFPELHVARDVITVRPRQI